MVNTGKPSAGCYMCRSRRIRCDQQSPHCRKCLKIGITCPGYQDIDGIRIIDETNKCILLFSNRKTTTPTGSRKLWTSHAGRQCVLPSGKLQALSLLDGPTPSDTSLLFPSSSALPLRVRLLERVDCQDHLPTSITPPIRQEVCAFFVSNFILLSSPERESGYLEFIIQLMGTTQIHSSPLPLALSAAAMASFGTRRKATNMLLAAEHMYCMALKATKRAVGDSQRAKDHATLASVILLSVYEQLRPSNPRQESWGSHLRGAVELLRVRGTEQLKSSVGRQIFVLLRGLLVNRSLASGKRLDPIFSALTAAMKQDPVQQRFGELSIRAAELRIEAGKLFEATSTQSTFDLKAFYDLLQKIKTLDREYALWLRMTNASHRSLLQQQPSCVSVSPGLPIQDDRLFTTYMMNHARGCRLLLHSIMVTCGAKLSQRRGNVERHRLTEYESAKALCLQLISDIISTVPVQFCVALSDPARTTHESDCSGSSYFDRDMRSDRVDDMQPNVPTLVAIYILWPVFMGISSEFATDDQRVQLRRILEHIANDFGVGQADMLLAGDEYRYGSWLINKKT